MERNVFCVNCLLSGIKNLTSVRIAQPMLHSSTMSSLKLVSNVHLKNLSQQDLIAKPALSINSSTLRPYCASNARATNITTPSTANANVGKISHFLMGLFAQPAQSIRSTLNRQKNARNAFRTRSSTISARGGASSAPRRPLWATWTSAWGAPRTPSSTNSCGCASPAMAKA